MMSTSELQHAEMMRDCQNQSQQQSRGPIPRDLGQLNSFITGLQQQVGAMASSGLFDAPDCMQTCPPSRNSFL